MLDLQVMGKDFETYSKGNENLSEGLREMGISACQKLEARIPPGYLGALLFSLMCEFGLADTEFGSRTGQACCVPLLP